MKISRIRLILSAAIAVAAIPAHANLVTNGGFESGAFASTRCNYMQLDPGDTQLTGWTVNSSFVWGKNPCDSCKSICDGFSGSHSPGFLDLSGFGASNEGALSQTLATTAGEKYNFSIDLNGATSVQVDEIHLDLSPAGSRGAGWNTYVSTFTATSSSSVLLLRNAAPGPDNGIVFLDNVSVYRQRPRLWDSAWLLFALGIPGLLWLWRRAIARA
jgi:hypothetical protein